MAPVSFEKFKPNEDGSGWPPAKTVFLLFVSLVVFYLITIPGNSALLNDLLLGYTICLFAVACYFGTMASINFKRLDGIINGKITFYEDKIVANDLVFPLTDISNMDFSIADYYGKSSPIRGFSPRLSQGVENHVSFDERSGHRKVAYFRMMNKAAPLSLYPFINAAVKAGAMSYIRAIDIVGVENVIKP